MTLEVLTPKSIFPVLYGENNNDRLSSINIVNKTIGGLLGITLTIIIIVRIEKYGNTPQINLTLMKN